MKKLLRYLKNEQSGSVFIYLFFIATLALFITTALTYQLENKRKISELEIEHLQLDMLHQQTYQRLINDWENIDRTISHNYTFPNGQTKVSFNDSAENKVEISISATREPPFQKVRTYQLNKESLQ